MVNLSTLSVKSRAHGGGLVLDKPFFVQWHNERSMLHGQFEGGKEACGVSLGRN